MLPNTAYYLPRGSTILFLEREKERLQIIHILKAEQVRVDFLTECVIVALKILSYNIHTKTKKSSSSQSRVDIQADLIKYCTQDLEIPKYGGYIWICKCNIKETSVEYYICFKIINSMYWKMDLNQQAP